ncbi:MAG: imidazole glycerol phosphate synthase, glutamine amidotransferase subunit [Actinobacteria bacterium RBG_16_64_13]|nr:MAG: imidazole glycerol phosphate synthase, glutamine amidotransferase subunit [Actinobacteria bacterium RBG_16_64_13]
MSSSRALYIVDYGAGNLRSVQKAFEHVGVEAVVGCDPRAIANAPGLVLPGVGAFGAAMEQLNSKGLVESLLSRIEAGVPFLGVCLGLQVLFEQSEEDPGVRGFGLVQGDVRALPATVKVPHIGWNQAEVCACSDLFDDIPEGTAFYFVHGYAVVPRSPGDVLAMTDYAGVTFVSAVEADNVVGVQFHPEKSSTMGLRFYRNFARRAGLADRS